MSDSNTSLIQGAVAMSTIATVLLVVLLVALFNPELTNQIRQALTRTTGAQPGQSPAMKLFFGFSGAIAPDLALLSGFVGDIVAGKYRYSVTSIVGIVAVIVNKLVWGRGEVATQLAQAGQAAASAFSGGPPAPPAAPAAAAAAAATTAVAEASTGQAAATTALNTLRAINAVGFTGPGGQTEPPGRRGGRPRSRSLTGRTEDVSTLRTNLGSGPGTGVPTGVTVTQTGTVHRPSAAALASQAGRGRDQTGGARVPADFNPCTIRGLGFLDTQNSPMGVAALVTVFFIYFLDMSVNGKRTPGEIAGNFVFGMFVLALNIGSYIFFDCYGGNLGSVMAASVKAAAVGVIVGGFTFLMYNYTTDYSKQWLPLDPSPAAISGDGGGSGTATFVPPTPGTQQPCPPTADGRPQQRQNGVCVPLLGGGQCGGPNDDGQFVCDAYVNGKRISTSVVDGSS